MRNRVTIRLEDAGHLLSLAEAWARRWNRENPTEQIEPHILRALNRVHLACLAGARESVIETGGKR